MSIYLDKIVHFFFKSKHNLSKNVKLKDYYRREFVLREKDTLCIFCPSWHVGYLATYIIRKRIKEKNFSYLTYDINSDILSSDYKSSGKYFENIINIISKDVNNYKTKYNFKKIYIIGFSLGCLYAMNVSIKNKNITKIILASPAYSLAESVWTGHTTQKIKEAMIYYYNIDLKDLEESWKHLTPYENIKNLKDKEIIILGSKKDLLTRYEGLRKLLDILKKNKINHKSEINNNLGHYGTIIKFLLFPKKYIK